MFTSIWQENYYVELGWDNVYINTYSQDFITPWVYVIPDLNYNYYWNKDLTWWIWIKYLADSFWIPFTNYEKSVQIENNSFKESWKPECNPKDKYTYKYKIENQLRNYLQIGWNSALRYKLVNSYFYDKKINKNLAIYLKEDINRKNIWEYKTIKIEYSRLWKSIYNRWLIIWFNLPLYIISKQKYTIDSDTFSPYIDWKNIFKKWYYIQVWKWNILFTWNKYLNENYTYLIVNSYTTWFYNILKWNIVSWSKNNISSLDTEQIYWIWIDLALSRLFKTYNINELKTWHNINISVYYYKDSDSIYYFIESWNNLETIKLFNEWDYLVFKDIWIIWKDIIWTSNFKYKFESNYKYRFFYDEKWNYIYDWKIETWKVYIDIYELNTINKNIINKDIKENHNLIKKYIFIYKFDEDEFEEDNIINE